MGLDVKYGLKAGLALDLTVNTDFAQAEVDEQQVNLTRFPLFFPEKRDFFLENSGQFTMSSQGFERLMDLFFSRRIGLSATGQPIGIAGGARVTGKMAGGNNVAVMDLQTEEQDGRPAENFLVARYSKDVSRRSKVGGLFVNKESMNSSRFNRTMAADALFAPTPSFSLHSFIAKTSTPGVERRPARLPRPRALPEHALEYHSPSSPTSTGTSTPKSGSCRAPASASRSSTSSAIRGRAG